MLYLWGAGGAGGAGAQILNMYCDKRRDILGNTAWAQGISWRLRLYYPVHPNLSHYTLLHKLRELLRLMKLALAPKETTPACTDGLLEVSETSKNSNWNLHCWGPDGFARPSPNIVSFFLTLIRFSSVYRHLHLPINGYTAAVAYAAVTAVTTNADSGVPFKRIASLEETSQELQKTARRTFHQSVFTRTCHLLLF